MILTFSFILPLGIIFLIYWWRSFKSRKYYQNVPSPPTVPILGHALDFASTKIILNSMMRYVTEYGGLVKIKLGPLKTSLIVADYKLLEFVLSSTNKILKKSEDYKFLNSWLGTGLLIGDGPKWKRHRKILTPAFHFQILENFIDTFDSCGEIFIRKLSQEVDKNSVDIYPYVTLCSLDVICETTMGISINAQEDIDSKYVHSVKEMCRIIMERSTQPMQMYDLLFMFTKNYRTQKKAIRILHEKSNGVIAKRAEELKQVTKENTEEKKKKAFLDLLLEATIDGQKLSHSDIREEVDTFMFAGHDTTASAMSFAIFCLAQYPNIQQSVFEEQQAIFEGERKPVVTYSHLQSMKYLEQVIKETLRLYPSVPIYCRQTEEDLKFENTCIPKSDALLLFPFGIHRNPEYFKDPYVFDPSRFENMDGRHPYAYIPFSAGPRNCIGQKFAMLEMKSIISKIVRNFELRAATPGHTLELVAETVLKSANGIKIALKLRP